MGDFAMGFVTGCVVTVAVFVLVFGVALYLKRRRSGGGRLTVSSDSYARVLEERGVEMKSASSSSSSSSRRSGGGGFVIGDEDEMSGLELESSPELTPQEFEAFWLSFQNRQNVNFTLTFGDANVEEILSSQRIKCMASGAAGARQKYYFFAREKMTRAVFLMEVFVLVKDREMSTEIRCANNLLLPQMVAYLKTAMKPFVGEKR